MLTPLNFPKIDIKLTKKNDGLYVWDIFRNKRLLVTPEEWVRQHVLHFLVSHKSVPKSLIASEFSINVNKLSRRCDGVVFSREGNPLAIIECKAPSVKLTAKVFHQVAQYNFNLKVNWLILTNGLTTVVAFINLEDKSMDFIDEIPYYEQLSE
jgi:hypothetical protein